MRITLQYATQVKRVAGVGSETVEASAPCGVEDLVRLAVDRRGDALRRMVLDDHGKLQPSLLVFVHDRQVGRGETITLKDGDVVTLMSPISGG